jgi:hypothetical protein
MNFGPELDRRKLLQRMALLVGATMLPGSTEALAAAVASGKRQLDNTHFEILTALADTIVPTTDTPGAVAAGVPQVVDAMLGAWASPAHRAELTAELDAIDRLARDKGGKGFVALTPAEREALLKPYDATSLKQMPPPPPPVDAEGKKKPAEGISMMQGPTFANPSYGKLKELIVVGFYYSEPALTHDLAYVHSPGEWRPSTPITPSTRPWGGFGLF